MLRYALLIGAVVCFGLATIGVPSKVNLIALGLTLWSASFLV